MTDRGCLFQWKYIVAQAYRLTMWKQDNHKITVSLHNEFVCWLNILQLNPMTGMHALVWNSKLKGSGNTDSQWHERYLSPCTRLKWLNHSNNHSNNFITMVNLEYRHGQYVLWIHALQLGKELQKFEMKQENLLHIIKRYILYTYSTQ